MFNLCQIESEEHPLYHRTNAEIVDLDETFLGLDTNWHSNGAIGMWCSTLPRLCSAFGKNCYEIIFKSEPNRVGWRYSEFVEWCEGKNTRGDYQDFRQYCLQNGVDVIYILDRCEHIGEVIVVNYDLVECINKVDPPEDKHYKLTSERHNAHLL